MIKILLNNEQKKVILSQALQTRLCRALRSAAKLYDLPNKCEVGVLLTDNRKIKKLNNQYRNKNEATDVLSFALNEGDSMPMQEQQPLLGDIVISVERALQQSIEYEHSLERELTYLAIHGFLHLLGYDHMNEAEKKEMRAQEEDILEQLGVSR